MQLSFKLEGGISESVMNPELVMVFGIFTTMFIANALNWTIGGVIMRWVGIMAYIPKSRLLPIILLLTLTAIYVQETSMLAIWITIFFWVFRLCDASGGNVSLAFCHCFYPW